MNHLAFKELLRTTTGYNNQTNIDHWIKKWFVDCHKQVTIAKELLKDDKFAQNDFLEHSSRCFGGEIGGQAIEFYPIRNPRQTKCQQIYLFDCQVYQADVMVLKNHPDQKIEFREEE